MNSTEKYHKRWLRNIAKRTSKVSIKKHLVHHMNELLDPKNECYDNPLLWVSSMYNLLETYELVYEIKTSPEFRLHRMLCKYEENKNKYTPPPSGKIPKNVKIKSTHKKN